MKKLGMPKCCLIVGAVLMVFVLALSANAEVYVAGQVGFTSPQKASDINLNVDPTSGLPPLSLSDLNLQDSVMYGGKVGYFFESIRALGIETEAYTTTPHVQQQNVTISQLDGGAPISQDVSGANFRVTTWAFNLVVRYPGERFQPYVGAGPGIFFAKLKDATESTTSTKVGLNTQVGMQYLFTPKLAVFGEWKYNHSRFNFDSQAFGPGISGLKMHYRANHFVFGVSYHF